MKLTKPRWIICSASDLIAMPVSIRLIAAALIFMVSGHGSGHAQEPLSRYSETQQLLLQMDRTHGDKVFGRLFCEADARMMDLLAAVDDETEVVSVNAQVILRYLGEPEMLRAIDDRLRLRVAHGKKTVSPIIDAVEAETYLKGSDSDPVTAVKTNARLFRAFQFNSGLTTARLIGYNAKLKVALVELVEGEIFTSGWHTVIKLEEGRWRVIADTNIWVH